MINVVFFGTPTFSAELLTHLLKNGVNVVAVVSKPDRPQGRSQRPVPTPVKEVALSHHLPLFQPEVCDAAFGETLASFSPDLFVIVAYGEILRQYILDIPRLACINVHTSLLPKYRGAAPIQRCLMAGETQTGITLMHMAKKMDAGDIIAQMRVPVSPDMTLGELENELERMSEKALLQYIRDLSEGRPLSRRSQDEAEVTFAPKVELENCEVVWQRRAKEIHNLVRGTNPTPGAWCFVTVRGEKKRLKIWRTAVCEQVVGAPPGELLNAKATKGNLLIATGEGAIELLEVQLEGKKAMSSEELCRGLQREAIFFIPLICHKPK